MDTAQQIRLNVPDELLLYMGTLKNELGLRFKGEMINPRTLAAVQTFIQSHLQELLRKGLIPCEEYIVTVVQDKLNRSAINFAIFKSAADRAAFEASVGPNVDSISVVKKLEARGLLRILQEPTLSKDMKLDFATAWLREYFDA
jgi:hypothetical protein